jgi:4-hydroxy-tetrahydrodipicolinate synthase
MKINKLKGCGTALVTPFKQDLEVDYDAFRALVRRQIKAEIHFLVPLGTTGETPCLEDEEKMELLRITNEEARGKTPVVAGAGLNSTKQTIKNMEMLAGAGVDAFLVVTPYYNKPTQEGLYNHFKAIAASTDKPVIMYNVPGRTGVNMTAQTCLRLAEIGNIAGIKEASGNYAQISEIIKDAPEDFIILSGNDDEVLSLMSTGAHGVISVASNVVPEKMVSLVENLQAGSITNAASIHHRLASLFRNCFIESNPIPAKEALSQLGLIENVLRPPLYKANDNTAKLINNTLKELKLL